MSELHKKTGAALFMVLGTLLVVIILANVVLSIVLSQTRLTKHQTDRIRAYYAGMAGIILTMEKIRLGEWPCPPAGKNYCVGTNCPGSLGAQHIIPDSDIPFTVDIIINSFGTGGCTSPASLNGYCITASTEYTYQQ